MSWLIPHKHRAKAICETGLEPWAQEHLLHHLPQWNDLYSSAGKQKKQFLRLGAKGVSLNLWIKLFHTSYPSISSGKKLRRRAALVPHSILRQAFKTAVLSASTRPFCLTDDRFKESMILAWQKQIYGYAEEARTIEFTNSTFQIITSLSMSMFLNLSHSPTLVKEKAEGGTSSPVPHLYESVRRKDEKHGSTLEIHEKIERYITPWWRGKQAPDFFRI